MLICWIMFYSSISELIKNREDRCSISLPKITNSHSNQTVGVLFQWVFHLLHSHSTTNSPSENRLSDQHWVRESKFVLRSYDPLVPAQLNCWPKKPQERTLKFSFFRGGLQTPCCMVASIAKSTLKHYGPASPLWDIRLNGRTWVLFHTDCAILVACRWG
jgi:hypothetical protein